MTFDGLFTRAMVYELNNLILTGRIEKIYQPSSAEIIFVIRKHRQSYTLLLSAHSQSARVQIISAKVNNEATPPRFCTVLRKHILGGIIAKIEQPSLERIIVFTIRHRNEIGDEGYKQLIVELMGKHSNIFCLDLETRQIIDCIKHIPPDMNRFRTLLPGHLYISPPEQNKENLLNLSTLELNRLSEKTLTASDLVKTYMGLSPFIAEEFYKSNNIEKYVQKIKDNNYEPSLLITKNNKVSFYIWHFPEYDCTRFSTCSELLSRFYFNKDTRERMLQKTSALERKLQAQIEKNTLKISKLKKQLADTNKADLFKKYGELITANLFHLQKGQNYALVVDYYDINQAQLRIPLDIAKSPNQNAQKYFTKYQKLKKSIHYINEQIAQAEIENNYLDSIIMQIQMANPHDFVEICNELVERKYLRLRKQDKKKKKINKIVTEQFHSSEGTSIFVGKNNLQNDYLTMRFAHKNDIWLHVKNFPGAHVIIRGHNPSLETLTEAALLAAYYSKARSSSQVAVDYTQVKHVKKIAGAKLGEVNYEHQKTIYVTPSENNVIKITRCK